MSGNHSNNSTGLDIENLKLIIACVEQITQDFDNMTDRLRMENAELAVLTKGLQRMCGNRPLTPSPALAGAFQVIDQSMARRKALRKELCEAASTFAQELINWAQALKERQSWRNRPDTGLSAAIAISATVQAPTFSGPTLISPGTAGGPGAAPQPEMPEVPDSGPATVVVGGASAATVSSLAWALATSIVEGTRAGNIVNYGNPYGPGKYTSKASYTGDDSKSPGDVPQPQAQTVSPPPPNLPPTLAPAGFPGDEPQNHHDFPQEFKDWFSASPRNINIDEYTTQLPQQWHTGAEISIHSSGYNAAWKAFIEAYPDASFTETVDFVNALKSSMGFGQGF